MGCHTAPRRWPIRWTPSPILTTSRGLGRLSASSSPTESRRTRRQCSPRTSRSRLRSSLLAAEKMRSEAWSLSAYPVLEARPQQVGPLRVQRHPARLPSHPLVKLARRAPKYPVDHDAASHRPNRSQEVILAKPPTSCGDSRSRVSTRAGTRWRSPDSSPSARSLGSPVSVFCPKVKCSEGSLHVGRRVEQQREGLARAAGCPGRAQGERARGEHQCGGRGSQAAGTRNQVAARAPVGRRLRHRCPARRRLEDRAAGPTVEQTFDTMFAETHESAANTVAEPATTPSGGAVRRAPPARRPPRRPRPPTTRGRSVMCASSRSPRAASSSSSASGRPRGGAPGDAGAHRHPAGPCTSGRSGRSPCSSASSFCSAPASSVFAVELPLPPQDPDS